VTIEGLWYAMGCPRPRRLPQGVDASAIATAFADGTGGYRSTFVRYAEIWMLTLDGKIGWYLVPHGLVRAVWDLHDEALTIALDRAGGTCSAEDIAAVLRAGERLPRLRMASVNGSPVVEYRYRPVFDRVERRALLPSGEKPNDGGVWERATSLGYQRRLGGPVATWLRSLDHGDRGDRGDLSLPPSLRGKGR
jgi:hypothetical protein